MFTLYNWSLVSSSLNQGVITAAIATPTSDTSTQQGAQNIFAYFSATDTLATIEAANYFLPVAAYQLFVDDWILVTGTNGSTILQVTSITQTTPNVAPTGITTQVIIGGGASGEPVLNNITAHAGGGQANATQLIDGINNVTVVATNGDSVKLPLSQAGMTVVVMNSGANTLQVYGAGTDTINGQLTSTGVSQFAGSIAIYYSLTDAPAGTWKSTVNSVGYTELAKDVLQTTTVVVSPSSIGSMYATPISLLAAPGPGKVILVVDMFVNLVYGTTQYTGGGTVAAQYGFLAHLAGPKATQTISGTDIDAATANTCFEVQGGAGAISYLSSDIINTALNLSNDTAPFAAGDSSFNITITYKIISAV